MRNVKIDNNLFAGLMAGGCILVGLLVLAAFILGPLGMIFGMNLLGMEIPYTLKTWFGAFLILFITKANVETKK